MKRSKGKPIFLAVSILLFSIYTLLPISGQAEEQDPMDGGASLVVGRGMRVPVFQAGAEARLRIPLENVGAGAARNVVVAPVISNLNDFPFEIDQLTMKRKISVINRNQKEDAVFYWSVPKSVESKTYPLTFQVEYESLSGGRSSFTETIYIKIVNDYEQPNLELKQIEIPGQTLRSGKSTKIKLEFRNASDLELKDIEIKLEGFSAEGILLDGYQDTQKIRSLPAKHFESVLFQVTADSGTETGTYPLDVLMSYKDSGNVKYTQKTKAYLPVEGGEDQSLNFTFENLKYPESGILPNKDFTISFDLKNSGQDSAKNVYVKIEPGEEILPKSASVKGIGQLGAGKSVPVQFVLFAKEAIQSKNYPIKMVVEYEIGGMKKSETKNLHQYVGVFVKEDAAFSTTPKIIMDQYTYEQEYVQAGKPFTLTMSFFNTNSSRAVKNIKISLSSDENIFSPVGSSNSFYIAHIAPNSKVIKSITLKPKEDAAYKIHNVTAQIEYEDVRGEKLTANEVMGIPVVQEMDLLVSEIRMPAEAHVGDPVALSVDFYNVGRSLIRNIMIRTEGNCEISDPSMYIGNLEAGRDNYYDVTVIPNAAGTLEGKIIFEYDDEIGNHYTIEKPFQMEVMEPEPMPDASEIPQTPANPFKRWAKIGGGVLAVAILALTGRKLYKKRKQQKEEVTADE